MENEIENEMSFSDQQKEILNKKKEYYNNLLLKNKIGKDFFLSYSLIKNENIFLSTLLLNKIRKFLGKFNLISNELVNCRKR